MHIQLALFAKFSSRYPDSDGGRGARDLTIESGTTVGEVVAGLGLTNEPRITFVNGRHAADERVLAEKDRLALFPPVAGG
ncbi:MAG: MoaD/ThiS family protein [Coriobacteriia bacterium]